MMHSLDINNPADTALAFSRVINHLIIVARTTDNVFRVPQIVSHPFSPRRKISGGGIIRWTSINLKPYVCNYNRLSFNQARLFTYMIHIGVECMDRYLLYHPTCIACVVPLAFLMDGLKISKYHQIAKQHGIWLRTRMNASQCREVFSEHVCDQCPIYVSIFKAANLVSLEDTPAVDEPTRKRRKLEKLIVPVIVVSPSVEEPQVPFPPKPPSEKLVQNIVNDFCADFEPSIFEEAGCAVCGQLTIKSHLFPLQTVQDKLYLLPNDLSITRKERHAVNEPLSPIEGAVIANACQSVCRACRASLEKDKVPKNSLANMLWLGEVPQCLKNLTYAERMMVARIRHNRCVIRVNSGRAKMTSNAIMFSSPTVKVYKCLPPSQDEINEVLAFVFTGPCQPTEADFARTPLLVRRKQVKDSLDWLKINHVDYEDLEISEENLATLPEYGIPVTVDYKRTSVDDATTNEATSMSVHDYGEERGTENGPCPFTVHGLTGDEYEKMSINAIKAKALNHLANEGKVLGIGRAEHPQSMYDNPQSYPQMFPWLFPYGLGGIGKPEHRRVFGEMSHKKHLLMYYDKRFQTDLYFPMIAFNHEQIKGCTTGSFLLTKKRNFPRFAQELETLDLTTLADITDRMIDGELVKPETDAEKLCFRILSEVDHVGGYVTGSLTKKKYMRNEVWALISFLTAPSWFLTLTFADNRHPLSLYYADEDITFKPEIRTSHSRNLLCAQNPVAAARFFHYMVQSFIKHVLGVGSDHDGLFGETAAYYAAVEQQGRLTLHLHMLLWIKNALSPQLIRDRIMSADSAFQKDLVAYLEAAHQGEFMTGNIDDAQAAVSENSQSDNYKDPTETLPMPCPPNCDTEPPCNSCTKCYNISSWKEHFSKETDDLLVRSNVHTCRASAAGNVKQTDGAIAKPKREVKGCLNSKGLCKARFPRSIIPQTIVDPIDGAIQMKKLERMVNTFNYIVTYLVRCNTDVTSLLSGTAIKAIVAYISDYVTKQSLKTHHIFSTIRAVFEKRRSEMDGISGGTAEARKVVLQVVNSLSSKMEIGSPLAALYLLGNPDHYTSHTFVVFWWRKYVLHVRGEPQPQNSDTSDSAMANNDKVSLAHVDGVYVATADTDDYVYRPDEYSCLNVYEWTQCSSKKILSPAERMERTNPQDRAGNATTSRFKLFRIGHPQFLTHEVFCDMSKVSTVVPNFVGGSLPRRDEGDHDLYCCCMVTLFVPWRLRSDLISEGSSWDNIFKCTTFTPRQRDLMNNFNIRYECNDARQDYYAQMKKREADMDDGFPREPILGDHDEFLNDYENMDYGTDGELLDFDDSEDGEKHRKALRTMKVAADMMRSCGWLDRLPAGDRHVPASIFHSDEHARGTQWMKKVKIMRASLLADKLADLPSNKAFSMDRMIHQHVFSGVSLLDVSYFSRNFVTSPVQNQIMIEINEGTFKLNTEQSRAYRIITNHASTPGLKPLRMYIGGMAGTGKSRVFQALISFFKNRKESYRFLVMGPTGSSAALLNGSTYHYMLSIQSKTEFYEATRSDATSIAQIQERTRGAEYALLDEISMVSTNNIHDICSNLAKSRNLHDEPFGGLSMIFAGDFAQLPPTTGPSLYSPIPCLDEQSSPSVLQQEHLMGKILWHQVMTVVMLRQNMRQVQAGADDIKFRDALINMRYGACTRKDIDFLSSRVATGGERGPSLKDKDFRNVSVITAWNSQKDVMNELGCARFADDTGQSVSRFVSVDKLTSTGGKRRKKGAKSNSCSGSLSQKLKTILWELSPARTGHFAGTLSLCVGLPVMIRHNYATELCITKGQEGYVIGWDHIIGPDEHEILDTVFIELADPPHTVNIPGLPENVVPLARETRTISCNLPNDEVITVSRSQIELLPNFAMTDFGAQGKNRAKNVVDLHNCKNCQSYYTALSRGTSAEGTLIIQGFNGNKITKGISGHLRQELRELEILDEITKARYESELPSSVVGSCRNELLESFERCKGIGSVPVQNHRLNLPIQVYPIPDRKETAPVWHMIEKKRKRKIAQPCPEPVMPLLTAPVGLRWDGINYSCSYDALFTIIHSIWINDVARWSLIMRNLSYPIKTLIEGWASKTTSLESTRDEVRAIVHALDPIAFPQGNVGADVNELAEKISNTSVRGQIFTLCEFCGYRKCVRAAKIYDFINVGRSVSSNSSHNPASHLLSKSVEYMMGHVTTQICPECMVTDTPHYLVKRSVFVSLPDLLCVNLIDDNILLDFCFTLGEGVVTKNMKLRGIIYYGSYHFTARVIDVQDNVWYHDGMLTGTQCPFQSNAKDHENSVFLQKDGDKKAVCAVYASNQS